MTHHRKRPAPRPILPCFLALLCLAPASRAQSLELFVSGLARPVDFVPDPTDDDRFFVVDQHTGEVRIIQDGKLADKPFFTLPKSEFTARHNEQGLLGMALDPHYADNHMFYLNYTSESGATHISRFTADSPTAADLSSEQVLLEVDQPWANHNCGCLRFGPDGMLYIGFGDGGAGGDPHGNGQNLSTILGSLFRIDVTADPDPGRKYHIPDDNPFVHKDDARPEIWAYGLRNPWRFEFDSQGRLWIADVGQDRYEEINLQPAESQGGENYGWNIMEGPGKYVPGNRQSDDPPDIPADEQHRQGFVAPIWSYHHHPDGSITGGYFYEGKDVPALKDRYIFADYQWGQIWSFRLKNGKVDDLAEHTRMFTDALKGKDPRFRISSFGRDNHGELYILDMRDGNIYKIVK